MCKFVFVTWLNFREPITKIRQTDGPIFSQYCIGRCPEWSRTIFLEIFFDCFMAHVSKRTCLERKRFFCKRFFFLPTLLLVCCTSHVSVRRVGSQSELRAFFQSVIAVIVAFFLKFSVVSVNFLLTIEASSGPYWENIGRQSFLPELSCVRSVLSRHRTDILSSY